MSDYQDITIWIGEWHAEAPTRIKPKDFKGRLLVDYREVTGYYASAGNQLGVDWRIYLLEDGRYLVWWISGMFRKATQSVEEGESDYAVLPELPEAGSKLEGMEFGLTTRPVPVEIVKIARAVLDVLGVKGPKYAVLKSGRKTPVKVFDTKEEAKRWIIKYGGDYLVTLPRGEIDTIPTISDLFGEEE